MLKSSTIAACVLAVSASVALAQTQPVPSIPRGAAPTPDPAISSQSMGSQTMQSPGMQGQVMQDRGMQDYGLQNQASAMDNTDNPRAVAITDEYGNQYNSRGERIGRGQPARQQMR